MKSFTALSRRGLWMLILSILLALISCDKKEIHSNLSVNFDGKYGQIEVGGKYVGLEFHHSRPLPARISFYYPAANSIDLSTDYWERDESRPLSLVMKTGNRLDTLETQSLSYQYTPYTVQFEKKDSLYHLTLSYHFCDELPLVVWKINLKNVSHKSREYQFHTVLKKVLRSCHSYQWIEESRGEYRHLGAEYISYFENSQVDSAVVFVTHPGPKPIPEVINSVDDLKKSKVDFHFQKGLESGEEWTIVQLIGSCRQNDLSNLLERSVSEWQENSDIFEEYVRSYAVDQNPIITGQEDLDHTARWSKAVLMANQHYLNGQIVPMPCPAEYNFFFTHDALLTDLGAVYFDPTRVKRDLLYLYFLTASDSILPHAYYWKDDGYKTEFCGTDNWNHFWFIILANSYFQHTRDTATVQVLMPIVEKSIQMMLQNKQDDDLIYARQPDWWDIGNLYGARAYFTILMIKTLQDFAALKSQINSQVQVRDYQQLAERMKTQLEKILWDEKSRYLLNMLDNQRVDSHIYTGSLLAAFYDALPVEKSRQLLQTAREVLLDPALGIRNVMPSDFHKLGNLYHFHGMEMGDPYIYINGGVWPQGNIWYGLGQLKNGYPEESLEILKKYLTLEGIRHSPSGQPSFYEYRNADQNSPHYGQVDKPTFLWAGGLYLYYLYHLMGLEENSYQMMLQSEIPESFHQLKYTAYILGKMCHLEWQGSGRFFQKIQWDRKTVHSAVLFKPVEKISVIRGIPAEPYLAEINCLLQQVTYNRHRQEFLIQLQANPGQAVTIKMISPLPLKKAFIGKEEIGEIIVSYPEKQVFEYQLSPIIRSVQNKILCQF